MPRGRSTRRHSHASSPISRRRAINLIRPIFHFAVTQADSAALIEGDRTLTYRALAERIARTAGHLARLGIGAGDRVGVCLGDNAEHLVALLAIGCLGAIFVPIDWRARPAEKTRIAEALALKLVIAEAAAPFSARCPIAAADEAWQRAVASAEPLAKPVANWHAPFIASPTSGSTGAPKFTLATHLQYHFGIRAFLELTEFPPSCRYLCTLPLHFSGGRRSCLAHLLRGDAVILHPALITGAEYVERVRRDEATVGYVVPALLRQLLALGEEHGLLLPGMDALISNGAPLFAEEKQEAARRLTPMLYDYYGTAATGAISMLRPGDLAEHAESVGQPHSFAEIEIVDDEHRPLAAGATGRLRYRGPTLGSGLGGPEGWESAGEGFHDGWYYPGELATQDARGYLCLKGRAADIIIRGGAKLHPAEIEAALQEHESVAEAAVIGRRATGREEEAVAFVVARKPVAPGDLLAYCRARLTPYKVPREIRLVPAIPKTATGKIDKRALGKERG